MAGGGLEEERECLVEAPGQGRAMLRPSLGR